MRMNKLAYAIGLIGFVGATGTLVHAEETKDPVVKAEKIEVTGSRIKRLSKEGPSPVQTMKREEIERTSANNAAELLQQILPSGAGGANSTANNGNASGGGSAGIGLRGLSPSYTLVLVNGRRVAPSAFGGNSGTDSFTDLNTIPTSAIERIEIVKDGAGAVYGADAIAGVINVILRKDYQGVEVSGKYGQTYKHDGTQYQTSLLAGFGDLATDKYNVLLNVDYAKQEKIENNAREFASADVTGQSSGNGNPGAFRWGTQDPTSKTFTPTTKFYAMPGCPADQAGGGVNANGLLTGPCFYAFPVWWNLVAPSENLNFFGNAQFAVDANNRVFLQANYSENKNTRSLAPTPLDGRIQPYFIPYSKLPANIQKITPAAIASDPTGGVLIRYRITDGGARIDEFKTTQYNVLLAAQGNIMDWDYKAGIVASENKQQDIGKGYNDPAAVKQALLDGTLRPFETSAGTANDKAAASVVAKGYTQIDKMKSTGIDFNASKEIANFDFGNLSMAAGTEFRREEYAQSLSAIQLLNPVTHLANLDGANAYRAAGAGSRDLSAAFVEFGSRLFDQVDANLAVRYDNYSGSIGSKVTPRVGFAWNLSKKLLVRASYSEGFKAPTLIQQYQSAAQSFNEIPGGDPRRCPATGAADDCSEQFQNFRGGNINLKPERSEQFSAGLVAEPSSNLNFSLDFYKIRLKDQISLPSLSRILSFEAKGDPFYSGLVHRLAQSPQDKALNIPGQIDYIDTVYTNLANVVTSGVNLDMNVRIPLGEYGKLTWGSTAQYLLSYKAAGLPGQPLDEYVGTYDYPRLQGTNSFTYTRGNWSPSLIVKTVGNYRSSSDSYDVQSYSTMDLSVKYTGIKNATFTAGVDNVLNRKPPFDDYGDSSQGYDYSLISDIKGRFFWLKANYKFM